jgi:hypothetical protein
VAPVVELGRGISNPVGRFVVGQGSALARMPGALRERSVSRTKNKCRITISAGYILKDQRHQMAAKYEESGGAYDHKRNIIELPKAIWPPVEHDCSTQHEHAKAKRRNCFDQTHFPIYRAFLMRYPTAFGAASRRIGCRCTVAGTSGRLHRSFRLGLPPARSVIGCMAANLDDGVASFPEKNTAEPPAVQASK